MKINNLHYFILLFSFVFYTSNSQQCDATVTLIAPDNNVNPDTQDNRQAEAIIEAINIVRNNASAIYHAGDQVVFTTGFHSQNGSKLRAYIEGCSNVYNGKPEKEMADNFTANLKKEIKITPNPSNYSATIYISDSTIKTVTVTSMEGKTIFDKMVNSKTYELDVTTFAKGIYTIQTEAPNGEIFISRLVKN